MHSPLSSRAPGAADPSTIPRSQLDDHDIRHQQLAAGQAHIDRFENLGIDAGGGRCPGEREVQPVRGMLMSDAGSGAQDHGPVFADLETGVIADIG